MSKFDMLTSKKWFVIMTIEALYRRKLYNEGRIRGIKVIVDEEDRIEDFARRMYQIRQSNKRLERFIADLRRLEKVEIMKDKTKPIKISEEIAKKNKISDFITSTCKALYRLNLVNKGRIWSIAKIARDEKKEGKYFRTIAKIGKSDTRIEWHLYDLEHIIF